MVSYFGVVLRMKFGRSNPEPHLSLLLEVAHREDPSNDLMWRLLAAVLRTYERNTLFFRFDFFS